MIITNSTTTTITIIIIVTIILIMCSRFCVSHHCQSVDDTVTIINFESAYNYYFSIFTVPSKHDKNGSLRNPSLWQYFKTLPTSLDHPSRNIHLYCVLNFLFVPFFSTESHHKIFLDDKAHGEMTLNRRALQSINSFIMVRYFGGFCCMLYKTIDFPFISHTLCSLVIESDLDKLSMFPSKYWKA